MSEAKRGRPKSQTPTKKPYGLKLTEEMQSRLAAAAYWTRRSGASIIEEGIEEVVRRLEQELNGGKPFEPVPS